MDQPQGFRSQEHPDYVCKLNKAIYGLKQAPRAWFTRLSTALLEIGFTTSLVDRSFFVYHHGNIHIFLLLYVVDDIILTGTHPQALLNVITKLQHTFPLKDLGPLSFFLGIQATHNSNGLHLTQAKYIYDLLHRACMLGAKPSKTPVASGSKLSQFEGESLLDPTEYRHVVGALQYYTLTRPDISFFVNQLCQYMHAPTSSH
ncbi:hypothetical protein F2P56_030352 [Juglans regia]|uniref:Reverse transcriptase Ty1/copia-type domain-containing protein n=1 Tax=Juglans regia TaxID=51240 RepID=A0A833TZP6_JUGRE|nr:hypothetical protein F2P56_030352 [Juglans regia]